MGDLFAALVSFFRFRFSFSKKTGRLEFDPATFPECTTKVEKVWSWKNMRYRKFLTHFINGEFIIAELS